MTNYLDRRNLRKWHTKLKKLAWLIPISLGTTYGATIAVPTVSTTSSEQALVLSSQKHNQIALSGTHQASDVVTITVTNGNLTLGTTTGLIFTQGDGVTDTTLAFTGALVDINNALNGATFNPNSSFSGRASINITAGTGNETFKIAVNQVIDAEGARNSILNGISTIASATQPGRMIAFGPQAYNVANFTGSYDGPMVAVAGMGSGKVVAMPDHQMLNMSSFAAEGDTDLYYQNAVQWLTGTASTTIKVVTYSSNVESWFTGKGYTNVVLASESSLITELADADIFVPGWLGSSESEANIAAIVEYVVDGGKLFICDSSYGYSWWWGKALNDAPGNRVLREAGIAFWGSNRWDSGPISYSRASGQVNSDVLLEIIADATNFTSSQKTEASFLLSGMTAALPTNDPLLLEATTAAETKYVSLVPTPDNPITDAFEKSLLDVERNKLINLSPDDVPEHRSADLVYGEIVPEIDRTREVVHIPMVGQDWSKQKKWQPIGLYCPPGEKVSLRFPAAIVDSGIYVRVSNDACTLLNYDSYKQAPQPTRDFTVTSEVVEVANHMGGAIFVVIPAQTNLPSFDVEVTGAVKMPYFRKGQHTNADWNNEIKNRVPGVVIIETDRVFNMTSARHARETVDMEKVATFWDRSYKWMHWLRGWDKFKPEVFPIMQYALWQTKGGFNSGLTANWGEGSGLDISSDERAEYFQKATPHGWYHESGHSHQKEFYNNNSQPWRPGGDGEGDANHMASVVDKLFLTDIEEWTVTQRRNFFSYREPCFGYAWQIPGLGGYPAMLDAGSHHYVDQRNGFWNVIEWDFGYAPIRQAILKAHEDEISIAARDDEASWMMKEVSQAVGHNLSVWFEWCGWTLQQADKDAVAALPDWKPIHGNVSTLAVGVNTAASVDLLTSAYTMDTVASISALTNPRYGNVVDNGDGTVTYTPNADYEGYDAFRYTLQSSTGHTGTQEIVVTVGTPTVENTRPECVADNAVTDENNPVNITVITNDSDVDGDVLEVTEAREAMYGSTALNPDGTITYTPENGFAGEDEFLYVVVDGRGKHHRATVFVTVNNTINQQPVIATTLNKAEALTRKMYLAEVRSDASDADTQDKLRYSKVSGPAWINVTTEGSITGIPETTDVGVNSVVVRVTDGTASVDTTVNITVANQTDVNSNVPPSFTNGPVVANFTADEDTLFSGTIAGTATDADGNALTYKKFAGANWLTVASDGSISGTPTNEDVGLNTIYVEVSDGLSGSDLAMITVDVSNTNDAPQIEETDLQHITVLNTAFQTSVVENATDMDLGDSLTFSKVSGASWLTVATDGTVSGVSDTTGDNLFVIRVTDTEGLYAEMNLTVKVLSDTTLVEYWTGLGGTSVSDLTGHAAYPNSPSSTTTLSAGFELPTNYGESYGARVRSFITPSVTGNYNFWIASDDSSELWLSTDKDPANASRIAYVSGWVGEKNWDAKSSQKSALISLVAGQTYYIEALMKEGGGGDHLAVAWQVEDGVREVIGASTFNQNFYPKAVADSAITNEDTAVTINVLTNDSDDNGDALTVGNVTQGTNGTVTTDGTTVTYTPTTNFNGVDNFTYTVGDGNGGETVANVSITVNAVNDAPVASDDATGTDEDVAVNINVLDNDSDIDGHLLAVQSVTQGNDGAVTTDGTTVTYTPNSGFVGNDSFTYIVTDGNGGTDNATVSVRVSGMTSYWKFNEGTGTLTVDERGSADGTITDATWTEGVQSKALLYNGSTSKTVVGTAAALSGTTDFTVTAWIKTSATTSGVIVQQRDESSGGWNGQYQLRTNGNGTVTFYIYNGGYQFNFGTTATVNDGQWHQIVAQRQGTDGRIFIDGVLDTSVTGAAAKSLNSAIKVAIGANIRDNNTYFNGSIDEVRIYDRNLTTVEIAALAVNPNSAPVAVNDSIVTLEDVAADIAVLINDSDIDGDAVVIESVTQPNHGSVVISGLQVNYTPAANYSGSDNFNYTINDGKGKTATATVSVTVTAVNDAPVAVTDSTTTDEDMAVNISVLANDSDIALDALSIQSVTQGTNGSASINGTTVVYTPTANWSGNDSFTYTITDGELTATETVTVTVNAVNDTPVVADDSATVDENDSAVINVLDNDSDIDLDTLTIESVTQGSNGTVSFDATTVTYTPVTGFSGADSFTYSVTDGTETTTATVSITVNDVWTTVPNVVGTAQATAEANIVTAQLIVGTISELNDEVVPAGDVISQSLTAGSSVALNSTVDLVISLGPSIPMPKLYSTVVTAVGTDQWIRVNTPETYDSMVVVATPRIVDTTNVSMVTRIANVSANSFDIIVQRTDDGSGTFTAVDVDIMVAEEGVYTEAECGVTMEIGKHTSTTTSFKNNYHIDQITPANNYTTPVVLGQVMSFNDVRWSMFWACNGTRQNVPSASSIYIGKAVGEDPDKVRNDETLGYIIIESGVHTVDGVKFETGVGADSVKGLDDAPGYNYNLSGSLSSASVAILSANAFDGGDQGTPVLYGLTPMTYSALSLVIMEDTKGDAERKHTTEQAAYIVFE